MVLANYPKATCRYKPVNRDIQLMAESLIFQAENGAWSPYGGAVFDYEGKFSFLQRLTGLCN